MKCHLTHGENSESTVDDHPQNQHPPLQEAALHPIPRRYRAKKMSNNAVYVVWPGATERQTSNGSIPPSGEHHMHKQPSTAKI